jgi:hypothetical protein
MNSTLHELIAPEIAQALIEQARAGGLSVNDYLRRLLGLPDETPPVNDESLDAFMADLEALAEETEHLPPTAIAYSRADIYFDHD